MSDYYRKFWAECWPLLLAVGVAVACLPLADTLVGVVGSSVAFGWALGFQVFGRRPEEPKEVPDVEDE